MRTASNHLGYQVQVLTPEGWRAVAFSKVHESREMAGPEMAALKAAAPAGEFRVYPALAGRK